MEYRFFMLKTARTIIATAIIFASLATPVMADNCSSTYNAGNPCPTGVPSINKTVQNPVTKAYVENLGMNDPKLRANDTVHFAITVTNTGSSTLTNIPVQDTFPSYIYFVSADHQFDQGQQAFIINQLTPGQSETIYLEGKVVTENQLPTDAGITCVTNRGSMNMNGQTYTDTAQICIERQVLGTTPTTKGGQPVYPATNPESTPPTGPESVAVLGLLPMALSGIYLRRKTN